MRIPKRVVIVFSLLAILLTTQPGEAFSYPTTSNGPTNYQGFDTCSWDQSTSDMSSRLAGPYYWTGVYIGGAEVCTPSYGLVNYTWLQAIVNQGWALAPLWVDLQAPCNGWGAYGISLNTTTARSQGVSSADTVAGATGVANNLGIQPGSIIYYDMEHYNAPNYGYCPGTSGSAIVAAVNAFLDGWAQEIGVDGYASGIYESASNLGSVVNNAHPPNQVWIAGGGWTDPCSPDADSDNDANDGGPPSCVAGTFYGDDFDSGATVWANGWLADSYWTYDQRLYQYTNGHKDEVYNGVTYFTVNPIDSDCGNGSTAPAAGGPSGGDTESLEGTEINSPTYDTCPY